MSSCFGCGGEATSKITHPAWPTPRLYCPTCQPHGHDLPQLEPGERCTVTAIDYQPRQRRAPPQTTALF